MFSQSPEEKDDKKSEDVIEEITVTARKREVNIQEAPIAVSVMSGEDFDRANIIKLDNFNGYVPGLVVAKNDGAGRVVAIRGVGWETAQSLATQPSVLVYLDGVYLANPLALGLDLGDIERVEVTRGPQGTEFGQGTTGGAINIVTRKPDLGLTSGYVETSVGDHGLFRGTAAVNAAFNDKTSFLASIRKGQRDGFAEIEGGALDGYELDNSDTLVGHFNLTTTPNENLTIRLAGFIHDSDQNGAAQKSIHDPNPDPRKLTQDYPSTFAMYNHSFTGIVEWQTPWGPTFKSLTGTQRLEKEQTVDGDRLTEDLVSVNLTGFADVNFDVLPYWDNDSDAFSQEFMLQGGSDKSDWVAGIYYLDHENYNDFLEATGPAPFSQFEDVLANPGPDTLPPFTPPLEFVESRTLTRKDSAVYGQGTFRLNDIYALTAGVRFQRDKSVDEATQFWFVDSYLELVDEAFTWKLGLDINLTPENLMYFLVSTGWKNGGNNPGAANGAMDVSLSFKPEEVTSFEIGSKNVLGNSKGRLNLVGFFYDYENYQFAQEDPVPFTGGPGNIPELEIYGLEAEFSWIINYSLRMDGFLATTDGEIKSDLYTLDVVDFLNSGFGRFLPTGVEDRASLRKNLRGNTPPKLVDLSGRLVFSHTHLFENGTVLTSSLDYIYRGDFQYRVFNNPTVDTVPSYDTTALYFNYAVGDFEMTLSATNLFDEDGVNSRFTNPYGLHTTSEEFIPSREIFGTVRYTF
ncbi:MAG: TonB-dependent receptor [Acidobacteriota bacterium]|nr:TonB-dependent receptor [Acidobacteriota bacterium]